MKIDWIEFEDYECNAAGEYYLKPNDVYYPLCYWRSDITKEDAAELVKRAYRQGIRVGLDFALRKLQGPLEELAEEVLS